MLKHQSINKALNVIKLVPSLLIYYRMTSCTPSSSYFGPTSIVEHWCSYNRPYWNWGGTDDHTTLQNKILVTQIFFVFCLKKIDRDLTEDKEKCLGPPLSSKFRGGPKACLILKE